MTAISYHDTINDLQDLDWSDAGPFARPEWFALLEQSGMRPLLATARNEESGIAFPLRRGSQGLESLTNWYAFTWTGLQTSAPAGPTVLRTLAADLARITHRVSFTKLPAEDGTLSRISAAFRDAGWLVLALHCDTNHILDVAGRSFAEYLAARPGQLRTTLKRKARKVEVSLSTRFDPMDWSAYEEIYADSWKPSEGDPDLLRSFAQAESNAGRFRSAIARKNARPIAAQFWTVDGNTAYIHKLAHRQSMNKFSPGTTLTAAMFERVIDIDKVSRVDFGTGDDPYKRDWMEEVRMRWRLTCLRRTDPRNWPLMAKHGLRKLVPEASDG